MHIDHWTYASRHQQCCLARPLTRAFTGRLAREIRNRFGEEMRPHEHAVPQYPVQAWLTAQMKAAGLAEERADLLSLRSGQSASLIKHHKAADLFASLVRETDAALTGRTQA